jgi:Cytochrome P460
VSISHSDFISKARIMQLKTLTSSQFRLLGCTVLSALALSCLSSGLLSDEPPRAPGPREGANRPQYTDQGELKLPAGFETWVFVGANLGIEYRDAGAPAAKKEEPKPAPAGKFHNIYINPEAYEHFVKTGKFPEQTILVLDIYQADAGEPREVVSAGLYPGRQTDVAVAVKNSSRPDGSTTDWAYYDFPAGKTTAKAFPDKACYDCHLQHADVDNVWVQFYPTLRSVKERAAKR